MEEKILKFDQSVKMCQQIVDQRLSSGDLSGALTMLLKIKNKSKSLNILKDIAELHMEMGLYEEAITYWFKYIESSGRKKLVDAYNGLGVSYYYLGNLPIASYYFNEQFLSDGNKLELNEEMFECFTKMMDDIEPGIRLVYPPKSVDYSDVLAAAKKSLVNGDFDEAISLYSKIAEGSMQYEEAQCQISFATFMRGDTINAIKISEEIVNKTNPKNVFALCNLSTMYAYSGKNEIAAEYFRKIDDNIAIGIEDLYKVASAALELEKPEIALKYFNLITKEKPYDKSVNFLKAMIYFNLGEPLTSLKLLKELMLTIESNDIATYYYKEISYRIENDDAKNFKPLPYFYKLPLSEMQSRRKKIEDIAKKPTQKNIKKLMQEEGFWELINWAFREPEIEIQELAVFILSFNMNKEVENYFLDKLLNPLVSDETKSFIVRILVMFGFDKTIGVVGSNIYRKVVFKYIDFEDNENAENFVEAYAYAFAYLALDDEFNTDILLDNVRELYYLFSDDPKVYKADAILLTAVAVLKCNFLGLTIIKDVASELNCDVKKLKELLKYIKES